MNTEAENAKRKDGQTRIVPQLILTNNDATVKFVRSHSTEETDHAFRPPACSTPAKLYMLNPFPHTIKWQDLKDLQADIDDHTQEPDHHPQAPGQRPSSEIDQAELGYSRQYELDRVRQQYVPPSEEKMETTSIDTSDEEYSSCDETQEEWISAFDDDTWDRRPVKNKINETYLFGRSSKQWTRIMAMKKENRRHEDVWKQRSRQRGVKKDPRKVYLHSKCQHMHRIHQNCPLLAAVDHCFTTKGESDPWCDKCYTFWAKGAAHYCLEEKCMNCAGPVFRFKMQNADIFFEDLEAENKAIAKS